MDTRESSPLRLLAPAALVVFGLALMLIVANGGGTGNSSSSSGSGVPLGTEQNPHGRVHVLPRIINVAVRRA